MLRPLPRPRLGIILLPRETRTFPFVEDVVYEIFPEGGVDFCGVEFLRTGVGGDVLYLDFRGKVFCRREGEGRIYQ